MTHIKPAALTIKEFGQWARIGRSKTYEEIGRGALRAIKAGGRTLILMESAEAWLASQPSWGTADA
jgi:hypothetical protein